VVAAWAARLESTGPGAIAGRPRRKPTVMKTWNRITGLLVVAGMLATATSYARAGDTGRSVNPVTNRGAVAYVMMDGSNTIAIVDIAAGEVAGKIPVAGNPHGGAITPDGKFIYTASMGANEIDVVDTGTRSVVASIDVGGISHHAAVAPGGGYVYVAAKQVVVVDTATRSIVARIPTDEPPFDLKFAPDGRRLYVLNVGSTITVIDPATNRAVETLRRGANSVMGHLAFLPGGDELYVTNDSEDSVSVLDLSSGKTVATIGVGKAPHGISTTRDGKYAYIANRGGRTFSVIDVSRKAVVATREIGRRPEHFAPTPDGKHMVLSVNTGSNRILLIDPSSFTTTAEVGVWAAPHTVLFSP